MATWREVNSAGRHAQVARGCPGLETVKVREPFARDFHTEIGLLQELIEKLPVSAPLVHPCWLGGVLWRGSQRPASISSMSTSRL